MAGVMQFAAVAAQSVHAIGMRTPESHRWAGLQTIRPLLREAVRRWRRRQAQMRPRA